MANKLIKNSPKSLKHYYYDEAVPQRVTPPEPDKTKTIAQLSRQELWDMLSRARDEVELQRMIKELKRNAGERETQDEPFKIDTKTPIDQLYHFGTKGMHWGDRKYQNKDGTRTALGKKRDRETDESEDHARSRDSKSKGTKSLSNDELKKLNERLKLEEDYKKLTKVEKSESWVKEAIQSAGKQALTDFSKGVFLGGAKLLVKEISPSFADAAFGIKDKTTPSVATIIKKEIKKEKKS